jgi:hypothetical protein
MYGEVFWPTFVMLEDVVFWPGHFDADSERMRALIDHYDGDLVKAEMSVNFIEIPELFNNYPDYVDEVLDELTKLLQATWGARLHALFPDRQFAVEFVPANEKTGESVALLVHQVR